MNRLNNLADLLRALGNEDGGTPFKFDGPSSAGSGDLRDVAPDMVERTDLYEASASVGRGFVYVTIRRPYVTPKGVGGLGVRPAAPSVEEAVDRMHREAVTKAWIRLNELESNVARLRVALDESGVDYRSLDTRGV